MLHLLTFTTVKKGDKPSLLDGGYNTIGFSNEQSGHRGELDRYCGMEKGIYFVAVSIMYVALITPYPAGHKCFSPLFSSTN